MNDWKTFDALAAGIIIMLIILVWILLFGPAP